MLFTISLIKKNFRIWIQISALNKHTVKQFTDSVFILVHKLLLAGCMSLSLLYCFQYTVNSQMSLITSYYSLLLCLWTFQELPHSLKGYLVGVLGVDLTCNLKQHGGQLITNDFQHNIYFHFILSAWDLSSLCYLRLQVFHAEIKTVNIETTRLTPICLGFVSISGDSFHSLITSFL